MSEQIIVGVMLVLWGLALVGMWLQMRQMDRKHQERMRLFEMWQRERKK